MKVLGVIPARGGSKRLPGKNIMPLLGKPLIAYTIEAALAAETLDHVVVSTDDDQIAEVSRQYKADVIRRPENISGDHEPLDSALRHALKEVLPDSFLVVCLQANLPVRKPGEIDRAVSLLVKSVIPGVYPGATAVATAIRVEHHPAWMKRLAGDIATPYMDCGIHCRQALEPLYSLDGAVIAVRSNCLLAAEGRTETHAWLGDRPQLLVHERLYSLDVDTQEDFEFVKTFLRGMQ